MWWYTLIDTVIVVGGSVAVLVTILRKIPWLLIALAFGAAFWFYGPVEAMLGPALKATTTPAHGRVVPACLRRPRFRGSSPVAP